MSLKIEILGRWYLNPKPWYLAMSAEFCGAHDTLNPKP
jgi:hypothetical protein